MKRLLYALSAFLVFFAGSCAVNGNGIQTKTGKTETRAFDVKDFTKVHLDGGITTARIVQSDTYSVSVTTDSGLFDYFDIAAKGDTLVIRERWGFGVSVTYDCNVTIAMPKIRELNAVNSSAAVLLGSFRQPDTDLDIRATGVSSITADVIAKNLYTDTSSHSSIDLKGSVENFRCSASGLSEIRAYKCKCANVDATVDTHAALYVYAEKSLNAHVSGMSSLYYRGNPEKVHKTVHGRGGIYKQ